MTHPPPPHTPPPGDCGDTNSLGVLELTSIPGFRIEKRHTYEEQGGTLAKITKYVSSGKKISIVTTF